MNARKVRAAVLVATVAAACGPHEDVTPQIPVQPGAAARAMALTGRFGANGPLSQPPRSRSEATSDAGPEPDPGNVAFTCLEARGAMRALARVPCEATFTGLGSTPSPEIAPDDASGLASNQRATPSGKVAIAVPPGKYRVVVGRGPEYALVQWDAEVISGKTTWAPNEGAVVVPRVVDTRGYLALDARPREPADAEGMIEDAARGIEIVVGDLAPVVQAARLGDALQPLDARDLGTFDAWSDTTAFLATLAASHPATAVAGDPARTYVRVDDDAPLSTWSPAREADLVRGIRERRDVVLTTGPFLRVSANGAPIGSIARPRADHDVEVKVHVECAPWSNVGRVSISRASGVAGPSQTVALRAAGGAARVADVTLHFGALTDDAFVVLAEDGTTPAAEGARTRARAMTGAIWVDADGDGQSLGTGRARAVDAGGADDTDDPE